MSSMTWKIRYFLGGCAIAASFYIIGSISRETADAERASESLLYRDYATYKYIRPLIDDEALYASRDRTYNELDRVLRAKIFALEESEEVNDIAVYFRDLRTWHWVGIDEQKKFAPASLFKIPVMIAFFKKAETNPKILLDRIVLPSDLNHVEQNFKIKNQLAVGVEYSVDQLIRAMVTTSDNRAMIALVQHLDRSDLDRVFIELGLNPELLTQVNDSVSPRLYSMFLRVLYNATYLSKEYSEKALALLSETDFKEGLVAGIPSMTKISHKYGERTYIQANGSFRERELHDCGIIYTPRNDYVLCVMTKGYSLEKLQEIIQLVSHTVYSFVQRTEGFQVDE